MASNLPPLEYTLHFGSEMARVYRALNSQHELRKWFMPSIILSKKTILDMNRRRIYFHRVASTSDSLIRYHWRPLDWPKQKETTILTFALTDHNLNRNAEQDGVQVEIFHDHWPSNEEREMQANLWPKMIASLTSLINENQVIPWWEHSDEKSDTQVIMLRELKSILLVWSRRAEFLGHRNLASLCEKIDRENCWHFKKDEHLSYQMDGKEIFAVNPQFHIKFQWRSIQALCTYQFEPLLERFNVEQDTEIQIDSLDTTGESSDESSGESSDESPEESSALDLRSLEFSLLSHWIQDLIDTLANT